MHRRSLARWQRAAPDNVQLVFEAALYKEDVQGWQRSHAWSEKERSICWLSEVSLLVSEVKISLASDMPSFCKMQ